MCDAAGQASRRPAGGREQDILDECYQKVLDLVVDTFRWIRQNDLFCSVDSHNRRHEEDKCWTLREMEQKLRKNTERRRRGRDKRRMETHGRSIRKRRCRSRSRSRHTSTSRSRRRSRSSDRSIAAREQIETKDEEEERSYWARKKADRTRELWKNLYAEGTVSVENGPDYSSDDEDIRPPKVRCAIEENTHKRQDT
ncbi:hypothetical protein CCR75_000997 [Bremia lactucae]|uniref:Uncharacterized protein n=1 Tax=Bremia lactucae TaxID=4779 RepID=A0A976II20_BRELC|nr:hypothetical protein CCR75_000997 [Bremia lactucae]